VKQGGSVQSSGYAKGRKSGALRRKAKRAGSSAAGSSAVPDTVDINNKTIPEQQSGETQGKLERSEAGAGEQWRRKHGCGRRFIQYDRPQAVARREQTGLLPHVQSTCFVRDLKFCRDLTLAQRLREGRDCQGC
jgi:hypothetical protein